MKPSPTRSHEGFWCYGSPRAQGVCLVRVYRAGPDRPALVVISQMDGHPGPTITEAFADIAGRILRCHELDPDTTLLVEHYPAAGVAFAQHPRPASLPILPPSASLAPLRFTTLMRGSAMTRLLWAMLLLTLLLTPSAPARADVIGYASATDGNLYRVDLTTATSTLVGSTGLGFVEGLAFSPAGVLYATDNGGTLYTLSTTTGGVLTTIGSTGLGDVEGLAFAGSQLIATNHGTATSLYSLSTSTATSTLLAATSPNVADVEALTAVNASSGYLLGLPFAGGSENLYSVTTTGATKLIGPLDPSGSVNSAALAYNSGTLYALDYNGNEYTVSPTSGALTLVGSTGSQFYLDLAIPATTAAVPEPSSLALGALAGVVGLGYTRRRQRKGA